MVWIVGVTNAVNMPSLSAEEAPRLKPYMALAEKLGKLAGQILGEDVRSKIKLSDILVAGRNFGCGSAREQATTAIRALGIKCVVASSFARTFYRNAINDGLPIVECPALYDAVHEGDELSIDLSAGVIHHAGREYGFPQMPESVRKILELGGLAAYLSVGCPKSPT